MRVGRNDLCPCGSRKKYKKCCMNKVVSLKGAIDEELNQLQQELLYSFEKTGSDETMERLAGQLADFECPEEQEEFVSTVLLMGIIFQEPLTGLSKRTLAEAFIQGKIQENKLRPSVLTQLKKWQDVQPSFAIITNQHDDLSFEVEDLFTKEVKQVKLDDAEEELEAGAMLFGFMLPYGGYHRFFLFRLDLHAVEAKAFSGDIFRAFEKSVYNDPSAFLTNEFPGILKLMLHGEEMELEWEDPLHEMVAMLYEKKVDELSDYLPSLKETGVILWNVFCSKENPNFRKPQVYAAALHYLIDTSIPGLDYYTQKELAELYDVSATSLSKAYRKLEDGLEKEMEAAVDSMYDEEDEMAIDDDSPPFNSMEMEKSMREIAKVMEGQDFESPEEMNAFVNQLLNEPKKGQKWELSAEEQAEELIYEAMGTIGGKRVKLAKRALNLDPVCPDAYTILGEEAPNVEQAIHYFAEGMVAGEQKLGKSFFKENKGMFWGLIETRPYMRATFNYAMMLSEVGKLAEAVEQYEKLIQLNENDNQGVRDVLFPAYLELREYKKAKELLEKYPEDFTATGTYNHVLLEYLTNGLSAKLDKLLRHARKTNPFVIEYLVGKRKLPKHVPQSYRPGSKEEAEIYVQDAIDLWKKAKALLKWLEK